MKVRIITEISCYMKNEPGVLGQVSEALSENQVNIIAIHSYAGQLENMTRFVVDPENIDKTEEILRSLGIEMIARTEVLEVLFRSKIGFMAKLSKKLAEHGLNIEVMYFTESPDGMTLSYFTLNDIEKSYLEIKQAVEEGYFEGY